MVSVGRSEVSCDWSPGDVADGVVSLPTPGVGVSGASLLLQADAAITHNPTTNTLLVFMLWGSSAGCGTGRSGFFYDDSPRQMIREIPIVSTHNFVSQPI